MTKFSAVMIGASAGGIRVLEVICRRLDPAIEIPIFIIIHRQVGTKCFLCDILQKCAVYDTVREPLDGEMVENKTIYVAPPGRHLVIENNLILLNGGKPVNYCRPSIDVLFKSAAEEYREKVIGIILSGTGSDGASGISAIKGAGGITIAQDESTSEFFHMPQTAINTGCVDFVLQVEKIPLKIASLLYGQGS